MKYLKLILSFVLFSNLLLLDAHSITHEKFKKQLKNTKDKINKLNKNAPNSNSSKSKDVNVKNKSTSKTDATCKQGKNFIFYGKTDKYVRVIGPEKFQDQKQRLLNFSFLSQRPNKNYFVEYVFKPNGTVTATNMTSCKSITYNWTFKGRTRSNDVTVYLQRPKTKRLEMSILSNSEFYKNKIRFHTSGNYDVIQISQRLYANCYNYQNPMCNQPVAETLLVGFRDLKSNKSYAQLKDAYLIKAAELKKKKEEERLAEQKRREAKVKQRRKDDVKRERQEKERREFREEAAKKESIFKFTNWDIGVQLSRLYVNQGFLRSKKKLCIKICN